MEALMLNLFTPFGVEGFQTAEWFWALGLLPWLWWLGWRTQSADDWASFSQGQTLKVKHSMIDLHQAQQAANQVEPLSQGFWGWWFWQQLLRTLIVFFVITALAEPVKKLQTPLDLPQVTQRDLVFVLESSASFLLPDYQQNGEQVTRMQAVKSVLQQFLSGLQGNRLGVVIYGEQAFSLLPLTSDLNAAQGSLQRLEPYLAGRTDEAMVEALGLALQQARALTVSPGQLNAQPTESSATPQKRAVILISDGLTAKSPYALDEAINLAQQQAIPIYTIGVGAKSAAADKRQYRGLIYEPLESESLQALAQNTGGSYFHVGGAQDLQAVLKQIDQLEGVKVPAPNVTQQYESLMPIFLGSALLLLAFYVGLLGVRYGFRAGLHRPVERAEVNDV